MSQIYPQPGWVEHDPEEIWRTQLATAREALAKAGITASQVQALGITGALYRTLRTTNPIENLNGSIAHFTRNVKRWKDGQMTLRWIAGALSDAKGRFRKLRGHRDMKTLLAALKAKSASVAEAERKAA